MLHFALFLYCITKKDLQHLASPETFPCPITNHPASRCHSSCYHRHVFHMNRCGQTEMIQLNNLWYPSSWRVPRTFARLQLSIENMWWPLCPLAAGSLMAEEANWEVTGSNCRWNTCELERWCLVFLLSSPMASVFSLATSPQLNGWGADFKEKIFKGPSSL